MLQFQWKPSMITQSPNRPSFTIIKSMATDRTTTLASPRRRSMSAFEARISLVFALASQTSSLSQRLLMDLASETAKYVFPKRFESRNLEEALMSVPNLETVKFKVLSREDEYEIREVEPYFIAETTMPGKSGFDFNGASQSFNLLAEYLFGKNTTKEKMEMTTPVFTRRTESDGEKMEMTTPVITKKLEDEDEDKWQMSFVMPSKYGANLPLPKDPSVRITEVPRKIVAVVAFSGFVTDEEVKRRESKLRDALKSDKQFQVKEGASVEVAQDVKISASSCQLQVTATEEVRDSTSDHRRAFPRLAGDTGRREVYPILHGQVKEVDWHQNPLITVKY